MDETTKELRKYAEKHKVSNLENAKHDVIPVVKDVIQKIERKDRRFKIGEIEYTGSIYQKLKIDDADEFDFDLPVLELEIDQVNSHLSQEYAYYKLQPQQTEWSNLAGGSGMLSSERVVQTFASYVRIAVDELNREQQYAFLFDIKTDHPAVTIKFKRDNKVLYNVDLVPVIKVKSWPDNLTKGWESRSKNGWPNADIINEIKKRGVSLVPKLPKGVAIPQRDIAWRYSFNNGEKILLLDSEPAIVNNCRRPVLRILKSLRVDYKWPEIRSYHLKTLMLHEFESHHPSNWTSENIVLCLQRALQRLKVFLQNRKCPHYFLPGINLFERLSSQSCARIIQDIDKFLRNTKEVLETLNGKVCPGFQVFVTDFDGKTLTVDVDNKMTIDALKSEISTKKGIAKNQFQLVYQGHYLEGGTIESNGIKNGATIQMQARLRGGNYCFNINLQLIQSKQVSIVLSGKQEFKMGDAVKELNKYIEKHKVVNLDSAKHDVVPVVKEIIRKINKNERLGKVEYTGSIYQKLKIDDADEFDFDVPLLELEIHKIDSHQSQEFAYYELEPQQTAFRNRAERSGKLSSERVVQTFADYVSKAVTELKEETKFPFAFELKTNHPAVTLKFKKNGEVLYDVDLVPVIKVKSWPDNLTKGWESRSRNGWPSRHMIDEVKKGGCSLVPKFPKGVSISKRDVAWRCTFNNAEKMLLLDSNPRTADNCRRPVLRILKSLRVDYGWPEIRSYHLKTLMLHEFESHHPSEWKDNKMLPLLKQALQRLKVFLENKNCPHYFLQGINLFEGFNREACKQIIQDIDRFLENPKQALEMLNRNVSTGSVRAENFQIIVKDLNGRARAVDVKRKMSIDQLKTKLVSSMKDDEVQLQVRCRGGSLYSSSNTKLF